MNYAIFIGGHQVTEFRLSKEEADKAAGDFREDGENGIEIVEEYQLAETGTY